MRDFPPLRSYCHKVIHEVRQETFNVASVSEIVINVQTEGSDP